MPVVREPQETRSDPWVGKISWRRARQPAPVFLPRTEEPCGLRSRGLQRVRHDWSDRARTYREAWHVALHGVTESQTLNTRT